MGEGLYELMTSSIQLAINLAAESVQALTDSENLPIEAKSELARIAARIASSPPFHVVDFTDGEWCLMHPLVCEPNLFACAYNRAAELTFWYAPETLGRFRVALIDGELVVHEPWAGA
jgi:hypothetical protein